MNRLSKCARGQIWYAEPDINTVNLHGHNPYYSKCRPYLIVSSDAGNFSSPDVIALPISTKRTNNPKSVDVVFDLNGDISRITCNKPTQLSIDQLSDYIATLSPVFMEEVEKRMVISLGMSDRWVMRDKQVDELRNLIGEYKKIQTMVSNMKQNTIDSFGDIASEFIRNLPSPNDNNNSNNTDNSDPEAKCGSKKRHIRWDEESMRAFMNDYENNSKESMMGYYRYTSKQSLQNTYYRIRSKLASIDASK